MAAASAEKANELTENFRTLKLRGHIGFNSLLEKSVKRSVQNGFAFNILCIGETGIGKSTLMNTLFKTTFESSPSPHNLNSVQLKPKTYDLREGDVKLKLTIIESVGYGDQINKEDSFKVILDYIDSGYEMYLREEFEIKRSLVTHDSRVHVCLYFINPAGHSLKPIDLLCMKKLNDKVNMIPIIAKADTLSKAELEKFRVNIMRELISNDVNVYQFPTSGDTSVETESNVTSYLPFAVVGSNDFIQMENEMVRAREYPWGTVLIENENYSDLAKLREMLICTSMEDLREQTHLKHYEFYRKTRLEQMGYFDDDLDNTLSFQDKSEEERNRHLQHLQCKEEGIVRNFLEKLKAKDIELKNDDRKLLSKYDVIMKQILKEKKEMEEDRKKLNKEIDILKKRKLFVELVQG